MDRRIVWSLMSLSLTVITGCGQDSSPALSATASAAHSDPAAQVAKAFLDAAIDGDAERAKVLYTPAAAERMTALTGIPDYSFQVIEVAHPADNRALVECKATRTSPSGESVDEELCLLLQLVDAEWRVSGMAFSPNPKQSPLIFSFENPERGPVPLQQWMAESRAAGQTSRSSPPRTAQESPPAGALR